MEEDLKDSLMNNDIVKATKLLERHPIQYTPISYIPAEATVLHIASILGYVEVVKVLLEKGDVDVNAIDEQGWSALIHSITNGENEVTKTLLDSQLCDINLCDIYGQTALHIEAEAGSRNATIAEWLIDSGATIDVEDRDGMTPFLRAIETHNFPVARCLYARRCNLTARSNDGRSCLHIAAQHHFLDMVLWMIMDLKMNPNVFDNNFQTPLMLCVQRCSPGPNVFKLMHHLLKAGTNINLQDGNCNTALLLALCNPMAIKRKHVQLMIDHGSDPNIGNRDGLTPIWQAVYDGRHYPDRKEIVQLLLYENCYLDMSCRGKLLFTSGVDQVYCYENFMCPLEVALDSGNYDAAKLLITAGCHVRPELRYDTQVSFRIQVKFHLFSIF